MTHDVPFTQIYVDPYTPLPPKSEPVASPQELLDDAMVVLENLQSYSKPIPWAECCRAMGRIQSLCDQLASGGHHTLHDRVLKIADRIHATVSTNCD